MANQSRHDISFAVSRLARRMVSPITGDWALIKRVVRYLKGTRAMVIKYAGVQAFGGLVDSDFAGDLETRKSTTGYLFTLHGGAVLWCSRLQRLVATSTNSADNIAAAEGVKESLWLRRIVGAVGEDAGPVIPREDDEVCLAMTRHVASSPQTKLADACCHFITRRNRVSIAGDL